MDNDHVLVFRSAVDSLRTANELLREGVDRDHFSPVQWAREMCSIHCSSGRRIGKTAYITERAEKGDLIITSYMHLCDALKPRTKAEITYAPCLSLLAKDFKEYNTIFIDEPAQVFKQISKEALYKLLVVPGKEQTFILLGE